MAGKIALLAPSRDHLDAFAEFTPEGVEIAWVDSTQPIEQQAAELVDTVSVIATPSEFPLELARACPNLKLVQVVSAGTDRINLQALGELGTRVANNGGGNAVAVAEHTIAMIVGAYRKLHLQIQSVKAREWAGDIRTNWFPEAHELTDKTVGIVGLGRIGERVARRLQGWDCTLIYTDVINFPSELEEELHIIRVSLDELLKTSDVVTLHVPLNRHTRGMISDRELALMKSSALLINACRGPVVDEAALIRALNDNEIAAAGLDVLEVEPTPADNPLLEMDNVMVTPHMAGLGPEAAAKSRAFAVQNSVMVASGEEPESVVLPE